MKLLVLLRVVGLLALRRHSVLLLVGVLREPGRVVSGMLGIRERKNPVGRDLIAVHAQCRG